MKGVGLCGLLLGRDHIRLDCISQPFLLWERVETLLMQDCGVTSRGSVVIGVCFSLSFRGDPECCRCSFWIVDGILEWISYSSKPSHPY